ncbi:hypothetical protein HYX02_02820 [Candidatus Woesearchaeota archaeon]|nr:hypothetical protein [Candidatus Woesearchaeota archaeon]
MELLQLREKEVFETLKKIKNCRFVLIGGYAVNAYTLPRFSVDCDIVIADNAAAAKIEKELVKMNYVRATDTDLVQYHEDFLKYEKTVMKNFKVSVDILIKNVSDRLTRGLFSAEWIFKNSAIRVLKGKTIPEELKLRIINPDALLVMKIVSCRTADIRDVFMLMPQAKDANWIKEEVSKRYDFKNRFERIKDKIASDEFKNNLQGVYGYIDKNIFEKHKKAVLIVDK